MTDKPTTPAPVLPIAAAPPAGPVRGREVAEANADADWWTAAMAGVVVLAARGNPFQCHDLVRELGIGEPDGPSRWGALFSHAHRAGLIVPVGAVRSTRRSVSSSLTMLWTGTPGRTEWPIPAARRASRRCLRPTRTSPRPATP